jgi:predicted nuclease of restriction endonuclease-like (RecB) superfamily
MPELPITLSTETAATHSYEEFLEDIKGRIRSAQARAINAELIGVYWQIGKEIERRQAEAGPERGRRAPGVVQRLSADLRAAFPGATGFSPANLARMRSFAVAWPDEEGLAHGVQDLPWGHIVELVQKLDDRNTRDWYVQRAGAWTRAQLQAYIATGLHEREGAAITNFERALEADDAEAVRGSPEIRSSLTSCSSHRWLHPLRRPQRGGRPPDPAGDRNPDCRDSLHRRRARCADDRRGGPGHGGAGGGDGGIAARGAAGHRVRRTARTRAGGEQLTTGEAMCVALRRFVLLNGSYSALHYCYLGC